MKRHLVLTAAIVLFGVCGVATAEEKADPTGTWKWSVTFNNNTRDVTLKLKFADGKLTGSMPGRNDQETAIENGEFKDGQVSFSVTRERNGQKFTTKYKGKLDGDTIKGKSESERNGEKRETDWEAKRQKS